MLIVTCPTKPEAESIALKLVEEKLAACAQISGPIESCYHWSGGLQKDQEFQLFIKSRSSLWPELQKRICDLHSFETPQILSMTMRDALPAYRDWVFQSTMP